MQSRQSTLTELSRETIHVLHVDNDPAFADLTETRLEQECDDFVIETVTSAEDGLERIDNQVPDCVVSDYDMPRTNGLEFFAAVDKRYPKLPFVLYTGAGSESVASDALSAGVTDYLQKGDGTGQSALLANCIRDAVQTRRETLREDRRTELMRLTEFAGDTGGFEVDIETGAILLTDGAEQMLDIDTGTEPTVENGLELFHPDDREDIKQTVTRAVQKSTKTQGTWRYQHPDGEQQFVTVTFTPTAVGDTTLRGGIRDVTEQNERQKELQRLQQAVDNANVAITLADPSREDKPLVYVNSAFEEVTGYTAEETLGRNCRFLQGEDTDPQKVTALREAVDGEESITVELRNYRKDGTEFWNRLTVTPIYDDGELVRYLGTQRDVTERKQRRNELESERRFISQAIDTLGDLFYVIDGDGTLRRWNSQVPEVTGYTQSELEGMTAGRLFPEDERESITDAITSAAAGEQITVEADLCTADDKRIPYEFTGARLTDTDETPAGVVGIGRDLTERRRHERRFQALVEESSDIISVVDSEGRYQYQSPSLERILGHDPAETTGDLAWEYIHPDDREAVVEEFEQMFTTPASERIEYRARHANGSWRWMEARGNEQLNGPDMNGFVINSRDITERKRQKKHVEVLDRVLRHNLRNKMNVIRSQAETIQSRAAGETANRASQIVEASDQLIETAEKEREITELVRRESTYQEISVCSVFQRIASTAEAEYPVATVTVACPDELTAQVSTRFEDAVSELVTNAIVHNDSPSSDVSLTASKTDEGICVEVVDTGPQISKTERDLLVSEQGRTQLTHGDGLGLLFVKRIVSESGGTVAVRENAPRGNIVQIILPE